MTPERNLVYLFVTESNRIEGIKREPYPTEVDAHMKFLALEKITIGDMIRLVEVLQPDACIRDRLGLNVRVGNYFPPEGSPAILDKLEHVLSLVNGDGRPGVSPLDIHIAYEALHPFTDGNGRSGRALWLWTKLVEDADRYVLQRGFLHTIYYDMLSESQR